MPRKRIPFPKTPDPKTIYSGLKSDVTVADLAHTATPRRSPSPAADRAGPRGKTLSIHLRVPVPKALKPRADAILKRSLASTSKLAAKVVARAAALMIDDPAHYPPVARCFVKWPADQIARWQNIHDPLQLGPQTAAVNAMIAPNLHQAWDEVLEEAEQTLALIGAAQA